LIPNSPYATALQKLSFLKKLSFFAGGSPQKLSFFKKLSFGGATAIAEKLSFGKQT